MSYNGGIDYGLLGDYDALPDIDLIAEGIDDVAPGTPAGGAQAHSGRTPAARESTPDEPRTADRRRSFPARHARAEPGAPDARGMRGDETQPQKSAPDAKSSRH